jgi:hypothetical protein
LTIPSIFPPDGHSSSTDFETPWQSIGAQGVNTLASKLSLSLIPPNSPFFRLRVDNEVLEALELMDPTFQSKMDEQVGKREQLVLVESETSAVRVTVEEAVKQLVIGGNSLIYLPKGGGSRFYKLTDYVVVRDPMGTVLEIVTQDSFELASLPEDIQEVVKGSTDTEVTPATGGLDKPYKVYTQVRLKDDKYHVSQEINGMVIPGSQGTYDKDKSPYIALRMAKVDGEDYGRSYVEQYIGDLKSLEDLSQAIVEGAQAAARVLFFVNGNGQTQEVDVSDAKNTSVVTGDARDVSILQLNKFGDFRVAMETIQRLEQRLASVFLMRQAIQRNAERVTAEEIRVMVRELEEGLGGIYSILSQELQLPLVNRLMDRMSRAGDLPPLPGGSIKVQVVTGIEALGRGTDIAKLQQFIQILQGSAGPEALAQVIHLDELARRVGTGTSVDTKGLIKSQDEIANEQRQAQMMQMAQQVVPEAAEAYAGSLRDRADPSKSAQQPQG